MAHVYRNSAVDWFVADSKAEVVELAKRYYRELDGCDCDVGDLDLDFEMVPDQKVMTIRDGAQIAGSKTAAEWAAETPKGHLATTND